MKKLMVLLAFTCVPLMSSAPENSWIVDNILYSDENCGEPIAYVDEQGNILSEFKSPDQVDASLE